MFREAQHICKRASGSTGTEMSARDAVGKQPLHRLIDFAASKLESYQKGCRKSSRLRLEKSKSAAPFWPISNEILSDKH